MSAQPSINGYVQEVEEQALGALLCGSDFRKVGSFLREDHFIPDLHRILFSAIQRAYEQFSSTTVPVVLKLLPQDFSQACMVQTGKGSAAYLASLCANTAVTNPGIDRSARAVIAQWARLKAGEMAGSIQAASTDPAADPATILKTAAADIDVIQSELRAGPRRKTRLSFAEAAGNAFEAAEDARQRGSNLTGITWGLADVNRLTGGIQRRDLTLIGARPSMGKTTVGLSTAIKAAKSGEGVGFISLEMDADKLAARGLADVAFDWGLQIPYANIIRGNVTPEELQSLHSANRDIDTLPLLIEEQSGLSMTDIRVKAEAMMEEMEARGASMSCLMIDHLGLIRASARYSGNRVQEISEMTAGLKGLAREYGIAVVALSQLNRAVESRDNKRPQLSDLRDSGSIEQDADTIIFLYREAYYLEREKGGGAEAELERADRLIDCQNKLEFTIAKQRNGPLATVDLFANMGCSAIRNGART